MERINERMKHLGSRICLIQTEEDGFEQIKSILPNGLEVLRVADLQQAVSVFSQLSVFCLIVDLRGRNSHSFPDRCFWEKFFPFLPVYALIWEGDLEISVKCLQAGIPQDCILTSVEEIRERLERLLREKSLQWKLREYGIDVAGCSIAVKRAIDFLDKNGFRDVRVHEVADFVGVSVCWLSRLFSLECCVGLKSLLLFLRVERAARLLKGTGLLLKEVARSCGFRDGRHFSV